MGVMSTRRIPPRGQQRDKPYREALRLALAAAASDGDMMTTLRMIADNQVARCLASDPEARRDLADRLDGKPAQMLEHVDSTEDQRITRIVHEYVDITLTADELAQPVLRIEDKPNGHGH